MISLSVSALGSARVLKGALLDALYEIEKMEKFGDGGLEIKEKNIKVRATVEK